MIEGKLYTVGDQVYKYTGGILVHQYAVGQEPIVIPLPHAIYNELNVVGDTHNITANDSLYTIYVRFESGMESQHDRRIFGYCMQYLSHLLKPCDTAGYVGGNYVGDNVIDDLMLQVRASEVDGSGGVLASAGSGYISPVDGSSVSGLMRFDIPDMRRYIDSKSSKFIATVVHEAMHVLGVSGTGFERMNLVEEIEGKFYYKTRTKGYEKYLETGGTNPLGIPIESGGGSGTAGSHWSESAFGNELMTGYLGSNTFISPMTLGCLEDLGYLPNYDHVSLADAARDFPW